METRIKKFLEFNGKNILFIAIDGQYYVAIRPICDALGIQYHRQYKNIQDDVILSQLLSKQTMVGADSRLRSMVVLPEKYVYGWLFSIRSGSDALQNYKRKCYDVLYEYFHGGITNWHQALLEKSDALAEMEEMESELSTDPRFIKYNEARAKVMRTGKKLKEISDDFIQGQLTIDFKQSN